MATLTTVLGSVTKPGRFAQAVQLMLAHVQESRPAVKTQLLDLGQYRISFADGRSPSEYGDDTETVVSRVVDSDMVIFASPVYRATFTGALKNLLDLTPVEGLMGKPCGIIAMGASDHHFLSVDWHLRDVLTWFGALVAPVSVYLQSRHFSEGKLADEDAVQSLKDLAEALFQLHDASNTRLGPLPLAARYTG